MRIKQWFPKMMGLVGVSFLVLGSAAAQATDKSLNLGKINHILLTILEETLNEDNKALGKFFTSATFKVEESGTDLSSKERLKIKVSAKATARGAVWSPEGDTTLQLDLAGGADLIKRTAFAEAAASVETDTLKLMAFVVDRLAPEYCASRKPGGPLSDLEKALCAQLTAIAKAQNISEVFGHFVEISRLHLGYSKAEVTRLELALAAAVKPEEKSYLEMRVKYAKEELAISYFVQREFSAALEKGKEHGKFIVKLRDLNFFSTTELHEFNLYLDDQRVELGFRLAQNDIKDMASFFKQRDRIESELLKVQNSEPISLKDAKDTIKIVLSDIKAFIGKP